jgi:hypothetical protein
MNLILILEMLLFKKLDKKIHQHLNLKLNRLKSLQNYMPEDVTVQKQAVKKDTVNALVLVLVVLNYVSVIIA